LQKKEAEEAIERARAQFLESKTTLDIAFDKTNAVLVDKDSSLNQDISKLATALNTY
jgi:hypothetical protein